MRSCKLRPGPSEGKRAFGAHIHYSIVHPCPLVGVRTPLLPLVGLCSSNVRAVLSNGNQAIMLHMEKSDRCRSFIPLAVSRRQRRPALPGDG